MDYKKEENKEEFLNFKSSVFRDFENFVDELSKDVNMKDKYKKAVNLTYWLNDYKKYLKQEKSFNPKFLPVYKKGSIVEVNLGFNIGTEYGGVHYGIVLTPNDTKRNSNLTILPLSSMKANKTKKDLHTYELFLGAEIYNILTEKAMLLLNDIQNEINKLPEILSNINIEDEHTEFPIAIDLKGKIDFEKLEKRRIQAYNCLNKSKKMKKGSFAKINQITTISKMRVRDPLNELSPLYNVVVSDDIMNYINKFLEHFFKF